MSQVITDQQLIDLANAFGATRVRSDISSASDEDGRLQSFASQTTENGVLIQGRGIGGNTTAFFDDAEAAEAFDALLDALQSVNLLDDLLRGELEVDLSDGFSWNELADIFGAAKSRDRVSSYDADHANSFGVLTQDNDNGYVAKVTGWGVGGNAFARFDDADARDAFHDAAEALIGAGLSDDLFGL